MMRIPFTLHARRLNRSTATLLVIWVSVLAALFVMNGFHYDMHALTLALLLVFGCGFIIETSHRFTLRLHEREQAEAGLRHSQEQYSCLVENSLTGIFISQDGVIRFSNARFAESHGFNPAEIIGQQTLNFSHPDERPGLQELADRLLSGDVKDHTYEVRCIGRDGREFWVQRRSRRIIHEGRPAILGNEVDITEQKLAGIRLKEANEQIKKLLSRFLRQQEVDRKEIASEINDGLAQTLSAIKMQIEYLIARIEHHKGDTGVESLRPMVANIQETVEEIRHLAQKLHPTQVDAFGMVSALRWLLDSNSESYAGGIRYHLDVEDRLVPADLKVAAFRMVQKILESGPSEGVVIYLQGVGQQVMLAIKVDLQSMCTSTASCINGSLEVADFKTRVESGGGQFALLQKPDSIRLWSSWCPSSDCILQADDDQLRMDRGAALT